MAHQHEVDSGKSPARGTRRRSLLKAGLALPLGSTTLLVACGGGGNGGGFAAGPAPVAAVPTPTPESAPAALAPSVVEAPPVDAPPPKPVLKAVKNVRVLNLQTPVFTPPSGQRRPTEDIKTYAQRALQEKFSLLRDALTRGLPKQSAPTDLCYFVGPEFFWNVNWDAVENEAEIKIFSSTYVTEVQKHVRALIALFPQEQYGKLALLPGTAQVLMKQTDGSVKSADKDLPCYEALNYVLVIDNFSKANADGSRPIAMWPKRHVSNIDFKMDGEIGKNNRGYWKAKLGKLDVLVQAKSTTVAAYYADGKEFKGFDNDPLGGVPFGVDVCLDYQAVYTDKQYLRMSQIEDTNYIIDFLIACSMRADPSTHQYLPSVQYIVRNDGWSSNYPPEWGIKDTYGSCEIFKLSAPKTKDGIATRPRNEMVPQTPVANPGPHSILFDSYFDVHPLGEYPEVPPPPDTLPPSIPVDALPSPIAPPTSV